MYYSKIMEAAVIIKSQPLPKWTLLTMKYGRVRSVSDGRKLGGE